MVADDSASSRRWFRLRQAENSLILAVGIILAGLLRFSLRDFASGDFWHFTGPWYDFISANGGFWALKHDFANYTPLYLYLLTLATYLFAGLPKVFAIKLISISFDFICAAFVYKLVRFHYPSGSVPMFAGLVTLFAPTVILNSSFWGQVDIIYTTGLVACLYFLVTERQTPALIAFGLAFAFKLQAIFLAPLLLILLLKRHISWSSFLLIPLVYVITILPAWLLGRPFLNLFTVYLIQADTYRELAMNAPNMYQWFPNSLYDILYPAGLIGTAAVVFLFVMVVYKSRVAMTPAIMVELATLSVLIMPYCLPKMHERYFFAADVLSIVFAFYFPAYFFVPLVVGGVSFFSYFPFLFGSAVIPLSLLAGVQLVLIIILCWHFARRHLADYLLNDEVKGSEQVMPNRR